MRDYKNVKVPGSYRSNTKRVSIKRVSVQHGPARSGISSAGAKSAALQALILFGIVAGGIFCWQAYEAITHAEMFQIAGVDVNGVKQISKTDLREIAGVFTGKNIFRVDLDGAVLRARANPWVKDVTIYRSLPNRISMVFVERIPAAILDTGAGRYLLDSEAVVIDRLSKENAQAWPLPVLAIREYRARSGEQVNAAGTNEALTLLSAIAVRGGWQLADVTIRVGSPETLSLTYNGLEFKVGSGNYGEKLRRLAEVMADVQQRGLDIAYVDLRPERQAAVMVKNSSKVQGTGSRVRKKS